MHALFEVSCHRCVSPHQLHYSHSNMGSCWSATVGVVFNYNTVKTVQIK